MYVCEIYSHMNSSRGVVYGFVVYTTDDDIKQLVCFGFGYTALGEAECVALAFLLLLQPMRNWKIYRCCILMAMAIWRNCNG